MPPRPFPFRLKIGIDICHIPRIRYILTKKIGTNDGDPKPLARFLSKVLTLPERQYFWHRFKDEKAAYQSINKVSAFLAGRWAAKEACRKACTHMGVSNGLHNIMILPVDKSHSALDEESVRPQGLILRDTLGPPTELGELKGTPIRKMGVGTSPFSANSVDGQFCEISISHDEKFATAVAMVPSLPESWHGRRSSASAENDELISATDNGAIGDHFRDLFDILEQEKEKNTRLEGLMPKDLEVPDIKKIQDHITLLRRRNHQLETLDKAYSLERENEKSEKRLAKVGIETKKQSLLLAI